MHMKVRAGLAQAGAHLHLQQLAVRSRGARIRLRLLARLSEHALSVGSAVRRFFERRANDHRPIHRFRGIEMATAERDCLAVAARLRRPGTGTFQRSPRTFPSTLRRGKHAGLQSNNRRSILPRSATPDETRLHQAARNHDAEESVAGGVRVVACGRIYQRQVRRNSRIARSRTGEQDEAGHSLLGQSLLRSDQLPHREKDRQCRDHSGRAALSAARKEIEIDGRARFRKQRSWFGARKNRKTWARGHSSSRGCENCSVARSLTPVATPAPVRPSARSCVTNASKPALVRDAFNVIKRRFRSTPVL